jgi:hypothetical protein
LYSVSSLAHAQPGNPHWPESLSVGGGTLNWQVWGISGSACSFYEFGSFSFTNSTGAVTSFPAATAYYFPDCGPNGALPKTLILNGSTFVIAFDPENGGLGTAAYSQGVQGIIYPKYVVVGVTYAPPGDASGAVSTVQYTGTTSVGTTVTGSTSFANDVGYSVQAQVTGGLPQGITNGSTGGVELTKTQSTNLTQTETNSSSITLNKTTSTAYSTNGYPTTFPITSGAAPVANPAAPATGSTINPHDWDVIQVWFNPERVFTVFPATSLSPVIFQWDGYAYDPTDMAGPDVYPIQVGCLNGDFPASWCSTQQGVLNRAWVASETYPLMSPTTRATTTAAGCPQTSESPSICPKTQDAYNILASDPLAYNPGGSAYTLLNSSPLPSTTSDGRFTQYGYPPNPVDYEPGQTEAYTLTQMDTQTESSGGSSEYREAISVSEKVSEGFLGLFNASVTYTFSDTMTWTASWLNTLTTTQTVADAFTIKGSNPPNYVPGEFIVYQDNIFGTYMFYPN